MKKSILLILILPLLGLILISSILHKCLGWDGFFINLITEVIGIIITVYYVERLINKNNEKRWKESEKGMSYRLELRINMLISNINYSFGNDQIILDNKYLNGSKKEGHKELVRIAKEELIPRLNSNVSKMTYGIWNKLISDLQYANEQFERHIMLFENNMYPEQLAIILDLLNYIRDTYSDSIVYKINFGIQIIDQQNMHEYLLRKGFTTFSNRFSDQLVKILECCIKLSDTLV